MTTPVCPKRGGCDLEWAQNVQTGECMHWIDLHFLGPIRRQLEERKITPYNAALMTDDDILLISRGDPPFMIQLFRLRHRYDYREEEDFQEQEFFTDERILAFLRRHE